MTVSSVSSGSDARRAAYQACHRSAASSVGPSDIHQGSNHSPPATTAAGALCADRLREYSTSCSRVFTVSGMSQSYFAHRFEVLPVCSNPSQAADSSLFLLAGTAPASAPATGRNLQAAAVRGSRSWL